MVKGPNDNLRESDETCQRDDPLAARRSDASHRRPDTDSYKYEDHESERSSDAIRADMARTRAAMDHTVDALQYRLTPANLFYSAIGSIREHAGDSVKKFGKSCGKTVVHVARENPIPAALVGVGLVWILLNKTKSRRLADSSLVYGDEHEYAGYGEFEEYHSPLPSMEREGTVGRTLKGVKDKSGRIARKSLEKVQDISSQAADKVQNIGSQTMRKVHDVGGYVSEKASTIGHQVQRGARQVQRGARQATDWMGQTIDEYPLAAGAAFFALGLTGGLAIPSTRSEDRLMGRARDRLVDQAQEIGSQIVEKGQDVAQRAVGAVKQAVSGTTDDETT